MLAAAGPLAGCSTTMQTAARLQLNDARIRATAQGVHVHRGSESATVRVQRIQLVKAGGRIAFVVTIRNAGSSAVSDLPISVGYTATRHAPVYLNAVANLSYFDAHLPAIAAKRQITWVYAGARALPAGAAPFAEMSGGADPPAGRVALPAIAATVSGRARVGEALAIRLRNLSGVPQYQLPVYAFARRGGRLVAAGTASVASLNGGSEQTVRLPLLGDAGGAELTVEAPPTIFN
jgi:hypothetical protein